MWSHWAPLQGSQSPSLLKLKLKNVKKYTVFGAGNKKDWASEWNKENKWNLERKSLLCSNCLHSTSPTPTCLWPNRSPVYHIMIISDPTYYINQYPHQCQYRVQRMQPCRQILIKLKFIKLPLFLWQCLLCHSQINRLTLLDNPTISKRSVFYKDQL